MLAHVLVGEPDSTSPGHAVGEDCDCVAMLAAEQWLLRGFRAAFGRPGGGRLEFASFSVKSMRHDFEGP